MNIDKFGRHLIVGVSHQTSTDKFGRHISSSSGEGSDIITKHGFLPTTDDGQYDVENKRLCNVQSPIDNFDCANKTYVDKILESCIQTAADLAQLKAEFDKHLQQEETTIKGVEKRIDGVEKNVQVHGVHITRIDQGQKILEVKIDAVELKRDKEDKALRQEIERHMKDIENIHKKVKKLEQSSP